MCYCLINICYERLVYHCSLRDDLGSLPRYCIFNVYLIRVWPRSLTLPKPFYFDADVHMAQEETFTDQIPEPSPAPVPKETLPCSPVMEPE